MQYSWENMAIKRKEVPIKLLCYIAKEPCYKREAPIGWGASLVWRRRESEEGCLALKKDLFTVTTWLFASAVWLTIILIVGESSEREYPITKSMSNMVTKRSFNDDTAPFSYYFLNMSLQISCSADSETNNYSIDHFSHKLSFPWDIEKAIISKKATLLCIKLFQPLVRWL